MDFTTVLDIPPGRLARIDHDYWTGRKSYGRLQPSELAGGYRFILLRRPSSSSVCCQDPSHNIRKLREAIQQTVAGGGLDLAVALPPEAVVGPGQPMNLEDAFSHSWVSLMKPSVAGASRVGHASDDGLLGSSGGWFEPGPPTLQPETEQALTACESWATQANDVGFQEHLGSWQNSWEELRQRQQEPASAQLWKEAHQPLSVPRFLLDLAALQNIPKKLGTRFASLLVQFLAAGLRMAHQQLQQLVAK